MVSFDSAHLSCGDKASMHDVIGKFSFYHLYGKNKKIRDRLDESKIVFIFLSAHINHIKMVAGVDHVGLGAGYDGISRYSFLCNFLLLDSFTILKLFNEYRKIE